VESIVLWPNSGRVLPRISVQAVFILLFASIAWAAAPEVAVGDLYAVVVGVAKYRHPKIQQLTVSDKDAKDFAEFLRGQNKLFQKIHITLLRNEEATKSEVEKHLFYKLRRAGKDDTVILFFSGHGADDPNLPGEFFFLTHDADPDYLATSAVHMSRQWFLQKLDSRRIVLVADACHAGGFAPQGWKSLESSIVSFMHQFRESEGKVILTSSRPDERSLEKAGWQNSIFTHFLLLGLKGEADTDNDGVVSLKELYDFVYNKTKDATGGLQHPQWEGKVVGTVPIALASRDDRPLPLGRITQPQSATPSVGKVPAAELPASLDLYTDPAESDVFISGQPVGTSDKHGRLLVENLPIGRALTVVVRKKGWLEASVGPVTFFSGSGSAKKTEVKLKQALGSFDLLTEPPEADVYAGDRLVGRTDRSGKMTVADLPLDQPIQIKVKKAGWLEASIGPITFSEGTLHTAEKRVTLVRAHGSLLLTTDPGEAEVFLDGKMVGLTNQDGTLALEQLPIEKPLLLKIKKKNWLEASLGPITFTDNKLRMAVQVVKLKPALGSIGLLIDPPGVDVYAGERFVGRTDASGKLTVNDLPIGEQIYVRAKKTGWQEASIGPITFSHEKLHSPEKRVSLLRAQGTLELITDPGGAEIYLDGKPVGLSNQRGLLVLDKLPIEKPLLFKIKKKDWLEASLGPIIFSEQRLQITDQRVRLNPAFGAVQLITDPAGSGVYLDNRLVARSGEDGAALIEKLPLGKPLSFRVKKEGWTEASLGPLTLSPDNSSLTGLQVKLARALGSLEVMTDPAEAEVYIDDNLIDTSKKDGKLVAGDLPLGTPMTLRVKKDGWLEARVESIALPIDGKKPNQRKVKLKPALAVLELRTDPGGVAVKMDGRSVGTTGTDGILAIRQVQVAVPHALEFQHTGYEIESVSLSIPMSSQGAIFEGPVVKLSEKVAVVPAAQSRPAKEEGARQEKENKKTEQKTEEPKEILSGDSLPSSAVQQSKASSCRCCFRAYDDPFKRWGPTFCKQLSREQCERSGGECQAGY